MVAIPSPPLNVRLLANRLVSSRSVSWGSLGLWMLQKKCSAWRRHETLVFARLLPDGSPLQNIYSWISVLIFTCLFFLLYSIHWNGDRSTMTTELVLTRVHVAICMSSRTYWWSRLGLKKKGSLGTLSCTAPEISGSASMKYYYTHIMKTTRAMKRESGRKQASIVTKAWIQFHGGQLEDVFENLKSRTALVKKGN